jgi:hypothetical protein
VSEALKQHDAGELQQQNRAEARVNVGLSCLEKQPRRRRREPFLLLQISPRAMVFQSICAVRNAIFGETTSGTITIVMPPPTDTNELPS